MRYFFNASGKCLAVITENPKNLDVPKEAASATYIADGDKGRNAGSVFLDKSYNMQNSLSVSLSSSSGSSSGYVYVNMSASVIPLGGITLYARGQSSGRVYTADAQGNGSYHIGGFYSAERVDSWAETVVGRLGSASAYACQCYSCDCGGGS